MKKIINYINLGAWIAILICYIADLSNGNQISPLSGLLAVLCCILYCIEIIIDARRVKTSEATKTSKRVNDNGEHN